MVGFLAIGFALFSGDLLPWTIRVLMLVGGLAALVGPFVPWVRRDPRASYSYPAQDDMLDGDTD